MAETARTLHARFRRERGLNETEECSGVWLATLGGLIVPLPNFRWRREILVQHDLHHIVTGFETTVSGELSLAAWELGLGCYSSIWAKSLCFGLLCAGIIAQPRKTIRSYRRGQKSAVAYRQFDLLNRLDTPFAQLYGEFEHFCLI
jgi:hypothetical protein